MTRRVAAVDCGTNSVRLLIAEADAAGAGGFTELDRDLRLTRLGQGVDATGRFAPEALTRTLDAVADFAARIDHLGVERVRFVAPVVVYPGEDELLALCQGALRVMTGEEEAKNY